MRAIRLLAFIGFILFHSCITENEHFIPVQSEEVAIFVTAGPSATVASRGPADEINDDAVKQFRILAFEDNGTLAFNEVTDITQTSPYKVEIPVGTYDFVFIGNEDYDNPAKSDLTTKLELLVPGTSTFSDIEVLSFPSKAFASSIKLPMSCIVKDVEILDDGRYSIKGTEYTGHWNVTLTRLAVRIDMEITTENPVKQAAFKELRITNIPSQVPILETNSSGNKIYNGGQGNYQSLPLILDASLGEGGGFQAEGNNYKWTLQRVILPSSVFTPDTEENALKLECIYDGLESATAIFETDLTEGDYQLPRNRYFKAKMKIAPTFELYLEAEDWDNVLFDNSAGSNRRLNVSAIKAGINDRTMARIWFSSNQREVFVDEYFVGSTERVNDLMYKLAGPDAANLHYTYDETTGEGSGYIDIRTIDYDDTSPNRYDRKIYLNAGGLKREISISPIIIWGTKIGYFEYVGAFWRNEQTGERLISGKNQGEWRAEIVEGKEWAVIAPGKSLDPKVWQLGVEPGDAEDYQVEGNASVVWGTGPVFFRLGCKSKNVGTPRYGRVRVTFGGSDEPSYIYLRQGEEADYIMRKEDAMGSGTRPKAMPFLPYNMTAEEFKKGTNSGGSSLSSHPTIAGGKGQETEFPSQAGAFFMWAEKNEPVRAVHPVNGTASFGASWKTNLATQIWNDIKSQDVCPEGYRRPTNGNTDRGEGFPANNSTINLSEYWQSLWLSPGNSAENALFGYYADGFFDRRQVQDPLYDPIIGATHPYHVLSAVARSEARVAYSGCLFYNPDTTYNASIFFPCPGIRLYNDSGNPASYGNLRNTGRQAYYYSSTSNNSSGHFLEIVTPAAMAAGYVPLRGEGGSTTSGTNLRMHSMNRGNGGMIRCVKE